MSNFDGINNYARTNSPSNFPQRPKQRRFWKLFFIILVLAIIGGGVFYGGTILSKTNKIFTGKTSIFTRVGRLIVSDDKPLKGEEQGQVNVLLLGMGGPGHEGPYLTDTMIVASLNMQTKEVVFTSIPRDFLVQLQGRGFNKVNAAYAYAEQDQEGSGGEAAIAMAEKITGLDIPYYASIDFKGFVRAVDHVGGLDITIDRTFTDSTYPNYNYGYLPPQTFTKGFEHMDGERALIFARSRHGNNGEGSDFSRSERQKKIMAAMKEELKALNITDLSKVNDLLSDFTENLRTNLEPYELKRLMDITEGVNADTMYSLSLDPDGITICDGGVDMATGKWIPKPAPTPTPAPAPTGPTSTNTSTGGTSAGTGTGASAGTESPEAEAETVPQVTRIYVVQPCEGKTLADINEHLVAMMATVKLQKEDAVIEIQNTTGKSYVTQAFSALKNSTLEVKFTTGKTTLDRSILYDNTGGKKPHTLEFLQSKYGLTKSDLPYTQSKADFVIVIGKDAL